MSKYQPLSEHFARHGGDEWQASFGELEAVLGGPLPKAARTSRSWWANDAAKSHSRAWAAHGWEVGDVDHAAERVVFRRGGASGATLVQAAGLQPLAQEGAPSSAAPSRPEPEANTTASAVQPPVMREAAESASSRMHATRALGATAIVTAAAAVVAGLGALAMRAIGRRR